MSENYIKIESKANIKNLASIRPMYYIFFI